MSMGCTHPQAGAAESDRAPPISFCKSKAALVAGGFLLMCLFLLREHWGHVLGLLPYLLILASPWIHFFMRPVGQFPTLVEWPEGFRLPVAAAQTTLRKRTSDSPVDPSGRGQNDAAPPILTLPRGRRASSH